MTRASIRQESTKSADGTEIAWYDFGGNGPDLLLAHATGFCAMVWAPVIKYLTDNFHCIAYDLRGHGMSASPGPQQESWDWPRYADDASAVLEAAGASSPFGVGHSCGGATELLLEERTPTFQSLYLFEPVIFAVEPPSGPMPDRDLAVRTRKRRTSFESRGAAIAAFTERGPFTTLTPECLAAYVDYGFELQEDGSVTLRCAPDDEAQVYVMASNHDGYSRLAQVSCPTVIARGETSMSFTETEMRALVERIPRSRFVPFDGLGHFGPLESPKLFAELVIAEFTR